MLVIEKTCKDGTIIRKRFEEENDAAKSFRNFLFEKEKELLDKITDDSVCKI